jgi:hypothetical protein
MDGVRLSNLDNGEPYNIIPSANTSCSVCGHDWGTILPYWHVVNHMIAQHSETLTPEWWYENSIHMENDRDTPFNSFYTKPSCQYMTLQYGIYDVYDSTGLIEMNRVLAEKNKDFVNYHEDSVKCVEAKHHSSELFVYISTVPAIRRSPTHAVIPEQQPKHQTGAARD